jgi:TetR/AcrR family macrolide resistance operon transcriptional repressor
VITTPSTSEETLTTTQWAVDPNGELADYVLAQIAATLRLMFPEQDDFQILQAQA